jgi:diadenylate cyclase
MKSMLPLDAKLSRDMLESIFFKNSPLHDGAVVIKNGRISSARGVLPVSENTSISSELGMRHRAALGISEVTDTFALVVSEQNGLISCAHEGELHRDLNAEKLAQLINPGNGQDD